MPDFRKPHGNGNRFDRRDSGRPSFGNRGGGGDRDSFDRPKFKTVCAQCGKNCEVPFRPTGERPVYCSDCFGANKNAGAPTTSFKPNDSRPAPATIGAFSRETEDRRLDDMKRLLDSVNSKVDSILQALATNKTKEVMKTPEVTQKTQPAAKTPETSKKVEAPKKAEAKKKIAAPAKKKAGKKK